MSKLGTVMGYGARVAKREWRYHAGKLKTASLELTYRCNLRCEICSLWQQGDAAGELTTEEWLRVIDELAEIGVDEVGLIGGEPLIVAGVGDLMRRIKGHGMRLFINTNATLLAKHMQSVCELADVLYISVDAADSRHDSIRGIDGLLERVLNATRQVVDYKRQHGLEKPQIHFHCTTTKTNVNGICAMVELGESVGVDVVSFQLLTSTPQSLVDKTIFDGECIASDIFTVNNITSLALDDEGVAVFREQMNNIPKTRHVKTIVTPVKNLSDAALKSGRFPVKRCAPVASAIAITPTGEAAICPALKYTIGNVRQASIREIWNGSRHRKLESHLKKRFFPVCASCCAFSTCLTPSQLVKIAMGRTL